MTEPMTNVQVGEVLALISRHDRRNLGETDVDKMRMIDEWRRMIGHNDYFDAMNAVIQHKATSTNYLEPAHINAICKAKREARLAEAQHEALVPPDREKFPNLSRQVQHMLEKAWNDPVLYAVAEAKLNEELAVQGFPPVHNTFRGLSPVGSGIDERPHK